VEVFDVIVIGGGPAGSTAAGFLNKMGHRVLLLERDVFPRHHVGESMIAATLDVLGELGLEEKLAAANFPVKYGGCFMWGRSAEPWCIRFKEIPGRRTSYQVKRSVFDKILLDHCAEQGVDVRQGYRVTDLCMSDGRVSGVRFCGADGQERTATARYTVDASGLAAVAANRLSSRVPAPDLENICLYGYWRGEHPAPAKLGGQIRADEHNNIIIKMIGDGWLWFIPLGRAGDSADQPSQPEISVGFVAPRRNIPTAGGRRALEQYYLERIRATPEWQYLLGEAAYSGEFHTVRDWSYRSERMAGPGYFAVGDAACFVDPILSSGVFLGVLYAKMCAIGINTILKTAAPESLIQDWYEGLYHDTYADYLEMARYWYHGQRAAELWMGHAQQQLGAEHQPVFADSGREAFIGLATGNTHAHRDYVLLRQLDSFPLPVYLRKHKRGTAFRDMTAVLRRKLQPAVDSSDGSAEVLDVPADVRQRLIDAFTGRHQGSSRVVPGPVPLPALTSNPTLVVAPKTRCDLEANDDEVRLVVRSPTGYSRTVGWSHEHALLTMFADPTALSEAAARAGLLESDVQAFCAEMCAAGILAPGNS